VTSGRSSLSRIGSIALTILGGAGACNGSCPSDPAEAVFRVQACEGSGHAPAGETFRIFLGDQTRIAEAEALIGKSGKFVLGTVRSGDGAFNQPWSWRLDPASVQFVENAIEVCDGCPSFVEDDLQSWVGQTYCPWSSRIVARER